MEEYSSAGSINSVCRAGAARPAHHLLLAPLPRTDTPALANDFPFPHPWHRSLACAYASNLFSSHALSFPNLAPLPPGPSPRP